MSKTGGWKNSLRNELGKKKSKEDATTKELKERNKYCEGLEAEIISLNSDVEKSNKWYEDILQVFEGQENELKEEIIKVRT